MDWKKRPYSCVKAYGDSKLANLLFMYELQAKFDAAGAQAVSVAAHPGLAATERQQAIGIGGKLSKWIAAPVSVGAAPLLRAATDTGVSKRDYFGPRYGIRGPAWKTKIRPPLDRKLAKKLWEFTEEVTGVHYAAHTTVEAGVSQ